MGVGIRFIYTDLLRAGRPDYKRHGCPEGTMELSRGPAWRAEPPGRCPLFISAPEGRRVWRVECDFSGDPSGRESRWGIASGGSALQAGTPAMLRRLVGTYGTSIGLTRRDGHFLLTPREIRAEATAGKPAEGRLTATASTPTTA